MTDMSSTKRQRKRASLLGVALVLANLLLLNYLSLHHYGRWDLTENKNYTLSPDTLRILGKLEDLVVLKYFITRDLPRGYQEVREGNEDLLNEFKIAAGGNMELVFADPSTDKEERIQAERFGVPELPLPERGTDRLEVKKAFNGITIFYADRNATIPYAHPSILEYELLLRLARILEREIPVVGFHQSGKDIPDNLPPDLRNTFEKEAVRKDRHRIDGDYQRMHQVMSQQYRVEKVSLREPVPDYVKTLILANPDSLDDVAFYHADQFLMRGGRLALLLPGVDINANKFQGRPRDDKLDDWLLHYGIRVEKSLVLDDQCEQVSLTRIIQGMRMDVPTRFPPMLRITREDMDQTDPIILGIEEVSLAFCSPIHLDPSEGAEARVLIRSSQTAWTLDESISFVPDRTVGPPGERRSAFDVVGILEGEFLSYFAARPVPESLQEEGDKEMDPRQPSGMRLRSPKTAILIVGSNEFLGDPYLTPKTMGFFGNAADYLTIAEGFGHIRARNFDVRMVDPAFADDWEILKLLKVLGTLGGAFVIVLVGVIMFILRKAAQRREIVL